MLLTKKLFALFCLAILVSACEPGPGGPAPAANSNTANTNVSSNTAPAPPPADQPERAAAMPVTMPVIDAMFSDPAFAEEAKQAAGLSDEELSKIRDAARNSVLQLEGDPSQDDARSTRNSTDKTRQEIEKILGPQKTNAFFNFVRTRWSGGGEIELAKPNSVPSDTRVVVNAAAYRMDLFKDGQLIKSYKVGIGYPEFPLPTGLRRAREIIFNPTWTPPDEPWVKGKVQPGKTVEAGSKLNPLGPIKIPIGLPSLIHGGKDPSRLGTFASHGCVGLSNAQIQDFAVDLASLSGTQLTGEQVKEYEKQKDKTENFKLTQPVPVELRYETIVVEDGKITFYRDVYEKGTNTEENLRRVLETHGLTLESFPEADRAKILDALRQMAVDAAGEAVIEPTNANTANANNSNSSKVTRNIKGKKEIVLEIPALKGKGYPAPVNLRAK